MRWSLALVGLIAIINLIGCSSKKTLETRQGTTTIETNALHNTVKVSGKGGTAIIGKGAVNARALGLPLYPGAIAAETGGSATSTKEETSQEVSLTTNDSFDEVYQWYKQRLPAGSEQTHMETPGGSVASFLVGKLNDSDQKSVVITRPKDKTTILLTHTTRNS